jgi:mono/diheme cytochrome c family protein
VAGTVARGRLRTTENAPFLLGRTSTGDFVGQIPVPVTEALLARGQERYDIYCSVCHGQAGDGRGIIMAGNGGAGYGFIPAPTYHSDFLRDAPDGYFYDVIANGKMPNMLPYAAQIPVQDRWAIAAWVRALQLQGAGKGWGDEVLPATADAGAAAGAAAPAANKEGSR